MINESEMSYEYSLESKANTGWGVTQRSTIHQCLSITLMQLNQRDVCPREEPSVLEMAEQQPKLLKNLVQIFSSQAAFPKEINSCGEGAKRRDCSLQTLQKMSKELLLQRMEWGDRESPSLEGLLIPCSLRDHNRRYFPMLH